MTDANAAIRAVRDQGQPNAGATWTGRVLTAIPIIFLLLDAVMKFLKPAPVVEAFAHLNFPLGTASALGTILLTCTVL